MQIEDNTKLFYLFFRIMVIDALKYQILQQFGFVPTEEQGQALDTFARS